MGILLKKKNLSLEKIRYHNKPKILTFKIENYFPQKYLTNNPKKSPSSFFQTVFTKKFETNKKFITKNFLKKKKKRLKKVRSKIKRRILTKKNSLDNVLRQNSNFSNEKIKISKILKKKNKKTNFKINQNPVQIIKKYSFSKTNKKTSFIRKINFSKMLLTKINSNFNNLNKISKKRPAHKIHFFEKLIIPKIKGISKIIFLQQNFNIQKKPLKIAHFNSNEIKKLISKRRISNNSKKKIFMIKKKEKQVS